MTEPVLFTALISDLHLSPSRPQALRHFVCFLNKQKANINALYILGDFFDFWVDDKLHLPEYQAVIHALRNFNQPKSKTFIMPGNRDFLIGQDFSDAALTQFIPDPFLLIHGKKSFLLTHGDQLNPEDKRYLIYRKIVRNSIVQKIFSQFPAKIKLGIAKKLRQTSQKTNLGVLSDIHFHTEGVALLKKFNASCLIHGHTHQPGIELFSSQRFKRYTLSDWDTHGCYIKLLKNNDPTFHYFDFDG
jgi:UDP-2,3-diacylglucosamine hydrolase